MTMMPNKLKPVALVCASLLALPLTANAFNQIYVFGDSLSDGGNIGRYTDDGYKNPLYNEYIAKYYGLTLTPSNEDGNNFAEGGAVAVPEIRPDTNTQDQVQQYLQQNKGKADNNGLYIHWIGGNDLAAGLALATLEGPDVAEQLILQSATAASSQVNDLVNAGANTIVVPTVPNIALTPAFLETVITTIGGALGISERAALEAAYEVLNQGPILNEADRQARIEAAIAAAAALGGPLSGLAEALMLQAQGDLGTEGARLTDLYNNTQDQLLAQTGGNIARVDVNALFQEVMADPLRYGFNNTAGTPCPPGLAANECLSTSPGFNDELSFLFSDGFHPGSTTHAILSQYMLSVLEAPVQVAALAKSMNAPIAGIRTTLDARNQRLHQQIPNANKLGVFGGYSGVSGNQQQPNALGDGEQRTNNLTLGLDYALTPSITVGAVISGHRDTERPTETYQYKNRGNVVAAFAHARFAESGWASADVHRSRTNFENIKRRIDLGPATRFETGSTKGREWGIRLGTGWDFAVNSALTTGPMLEYIWDKSKVDGYAEDSDLSTSMRFGDQRRTSKIAAIGWRLDSTLGVINPYANIRYLRQMGDRDHAVSGGIKSTLTSFSRDSATDARSWADLTVGANVNITKNLQAFGALSRTNGLNQGEQTRYNLGLSANF
ncbi:MAG: autotransporter domain-containing protein [Neisseriaceae bacterium]|nr:autotransporter domain-containing protein [Neisseriaceae bacterium]